MPRKIAPTTDASTGRVIDPAVARERAEKRDLEEKIAAHKAAVMERVARFMREAIDLQATTIGLPLSLEMLFDCPEAAARPIRAREERAALYHRRCLAFLRLGRTPEQAEAEARDLEGKDPGGRAPDDAARAIRVIASFFEEQRLKDVKVRALVYRIAREALGPQLFPSTKNPARFVRDALHRLTPTARSRLHGDFTLYGLAQSYRALTPMTPTHNEAWDRAETELAASLNPNTEELDEIIGQAIREVGVGNRDGSPPESGRSKR